MGSIMFAPISIIPFNTIPLTYKVQLVLSFSQPSLARNSKLKWQQPVFITRSSVFDPTFCYVPSQRTFYLVPFCYGSVFIKDRLPRFCSKIIYSKEKGMTMEGHTFCDSHFQGIRVHIFAIATSSLTNTLRPGSQYQNNDITAR